MQGMRGVAAASAMVVANPRTPPESENTGGIDAIRILEGRGDRGWIFWHSHRRNFIRNPLINRKFWGLF